MKNKTVTLMLVFLTISCVLVSGQGPMSRSPWVQPNINSSYLGPEVYLFENGFKYNMEVRRNVHSYLEDGYYGDVYVQNIGFSAAKRIIYSNHVGLLDDFIPETALAVLNREELRLLREKIEANTRNSGRRHLRGWNIDIKEVDKRNMECILAFENARPNPNLKKSDLVGYWEKDFGMSPDWLPNITLNDDNTIEGFLSLGDDNFKGTYRIENGFLVVLVTEQYVGVPEVTDDTYFYWYDSLWPNSVTYRVERITDEWGNSYREESIYYKEPIKMVFPVGELTRFIHQNGNVTQRRLIGLLNYHKPN
jgi:hypothetical protein